MATGFVIHNIEYRLREKLIAEIYRVLRHGGIFVNADKIARDDMEKRAEVYVEQIRRFDVFDEIGKPDIKTEWIEHYKIDEQPHIVYVESIALAQMSRVGFRGASVIYREMMEAVVVGAK